MKNTVLTKVLLLLFIVIVPLAIISSVTINNVNKQLERQMLMSMDTDSLNFSTQLNNSIKDIYISNMPLSFQSNIQMLTIAGDSLSAYDKAQSTNMICEQLSNLCFTNKYLESAHIYFRDSKRVYNTRGFPKGSFDEFTDQQYYALSTLALHPETIHRYINPIIKKELLAIFIVPFNQSNPRYIIEMVLSEEYIHSIAETKNMFTDNLYYIEMGGKPVATNLSKDSFSVMSNAEPMSASPFFNELRINGRTYYMRKYDLPYCGGSYVRLVSTKGVTAPLQMSSMFLKIFFVMLAASCTLFFIGIYKLVHKPLIKLTKAFEAVENGDFDITIQETKSGDFSYLYYAFNDMTKRLNELIDRNYNQKIFLQKAELKQLQAQINPHFLYNSFFLLQTMLKTDAIEESRQMAKQLGLYFRYITKNNTEYVTLENEYNHAKIYANIQSLRFDKRIEIQIEEIPNEYKNILSPKLILQPILENSFNYGLANKVSDGLLSVRFEKRDNLIDIIIEDNGDSLSDKTIERLRTELHDVTLSTDTREMSGLMNIHRRLVIFSKSQGRIEVSRSHMGGLRVDVILNTEGTV